MGLVTGPCSTGLYLPSFLVCFQPSRSYADPEEDRGSGPPPPPLKYHKAIGFLSNTGPDPLENHKATMPAFYVGPTSARQRPLIVVFESSLPSSNKQTKRCQSLTPSDKTFWIRECHCFTLFVFLLSCDS